MVTANRLSDGAVVYYTEAKGWSENFVDGAGVARQGQRGRRARRQRRTR
jgi:hypothetical protein